MSSLNELLSRKLKQRTEDGLFRKLSPDSTLVDFCSNDYLGLARSSELRQQITERLNGLDLRSNGATGSRLLSGNSRYYEEVEGKLANIFKAESSLIFNSGYAANQSVLSSIPQKDDTILYDELAHACIKDGARLSLAKRYSFRHNDIEDLERKIQLVKAGRIYIAIESVYSMDGDRAPLESIVALADRYDASIILDEAHSTGVYGKNGSGLATQLNLHDKIDIRIHTFGKAMGVHGACVVGRATLREYLINFARPFIYTTALPVHSVASIECTFDYLGSNPHLQKNIQQRIDEFTSSLNSKINTRSTSAIQTLIFSGNEKVKLAATKIQAMGFDVRPIMSPTVAKGAERLRICLHTFNTTEETKQLASAINKIMNNQ